MTIRVPADKLGRQVAGIYRAWGMPEGHVVATVEVMLGADLSGIDSHGVNMMTLYDQLRTAGKITMTPEVRVVRENAATALVDAGGGLGHFPSVTAMRLAIAKAKAAGTGAVAVRNSHHYGAAGVYARMAAEAGLVGLSTTATFSPAIVPTFGAEAVFGTNPIAFAAPTRRNPPFLLDMATSTVAMGKIKLASQARKPMPLGWSLGRDGRPTSDADEAMVSRLLSPLGGTRELGGHKGYGLAMMVEILSVTLSGAAFVALRLKRDPDAARHDVGHFFYAMDPDCFREAGAFEADMDEMIDALRATRPLDPAQPVIVPGDPEHAARIERAANGIPLSDAVIADVKRIASAAGAEFILT